jgi:hypothetical protein
VEKEGFLEVGFWGRVRFFFLAMTSEDILVQLIIFD